MPKSKSPLRHDIAFGARDVTPVALAALSYGVAFGLLAIQAGFSVLQAITMSALVFGGSAQLVTLDQLTAGAGATAAILAGIALNMRILLITASMRYALVGQPWWKISIGAHLATDASIALMQSAKTRGATASYWYLFGGGIFLLLAWVVATGVGSLLSQNIPDPNRFGLDFAIVALFVALLPGLWRGRADLMPWSVAAGTVIGFSAIFPGQSGWALIAGALLGAVTAGVSDGK